LSGSSQVTSAPGCRIGASIPGGVNRHILVAKKADLFDGKSRITVNFVLLLDLELDRNPLPSAGIVAPTTLPTVTPEINTAAPSFNRPR